MATSLGKNDCVIALSVDVCFYVDINECFGPGAACRNGRCTNSLGSFTCECPDGYVLSYDGRDCRGNVVIAAAAAAAHIVR